MSETMTVPPLVNKMMKMVLRSPAHGMVSKSVLLITFTGCKSGKSYTTPVSYSQAGDLVTIFTHANWWKNLCGGGTAGRALGAAERGGTASRTLGAAERGGTAGRTLGAAERGGAPVTLRLRGQVRQGLAQPVSGNPQAIAEGLSAHLRMVPSDARWYGVTFDDQGNPRMDEVEKAVQSVVMIRIRLCE